jgi:SAM-dependent methyltransferase
MSDPHAPVPEIADGLSAAYGHVVGADFERHTLDGWLMLPGRELTSADVYLDGVRVGTAGLEERAAVTEFYRHWPFPPPGRVGYRLGLKPAQLPPRVARATVVGSGGGRPLARMRTVLFPAAAVPPIPVPYGDLIELTQGNTDPDEYRRLGFRYYCQLREAAARHLDPLKWRRVLDWGCGSGRISASFLADPTGVRLTGSDLNPWAIEWCRENLTGGEFHVVDPLPPLPYADESFDLVISFSVVGGCGPAEYALWLPELRRVLTRGGVLLITIQGVFAARVLYPGEAVEQLNREGIFDGCLYDSMHPPPPGDRRYRGGKYLTQEYVAREWSPYFEILEHLDGEINSDLDLVVARRKG